MVVACVCIMDRALLLHQRTIQHVVYSESTPVYQYTYDMVCVCTHACTIATFRQVIAEAMLLDSLLLPCVFNFISVVLCRLLTIGALEGLMSPVVPVYTVFTLLCHSGTKFRNLDVVQLSS